MKYERKSGLLFNTIPLYEGTYGETLVNMCLYELLNFVDSHTDIDAKDFADSYVERSWGNQYGSWVSLGYSM